MTSEPVPGGFEEVVGEVHACGGLTSLSLGRLRDALGVQRLGKFVLRDIATELKRRGLDYFPADVLDQNPWPRQDHQVRVYVNDQSVLARVIRAVLDPTSAGDELLLETSSTSESARLGELERAVERARSAVRDALADLDGVTLEDGES